LVFDAKTEIKIKTMFRRLLPVAILIMALFSCRKDPNLPPEPRIEFRSFEVFDTLDILGNLSKGGRLKFYFEDGDGDLGIKEPVMPWDDSTNIFLTLYKKINGTYVPADTGDPLYPSNYRIPILNRPGQSKTLKGTISVTFLYLFYNPLDTIKYDFFIRDRAYNDSNTDTTCDIALRENSICTSN
jgi:hypothetical protein